MRCGKIAKKKELISPASKRIFSMFQSREWIWIKHYWPLLYKQPLNPSCSFGEMVHSQRKQKEPNTPFPLTTSFAQR